MSAFLFVSFLPKRGGDRGLLASVIGIMVFLSSLAAVVGIYLGDITQSASAEMASGLSVQIVAADSNDRERQVQSVLEFLRQTPGVKNAERLPVRELQELLEPWLGAGNVTDELPIPEMITVDLETQGQLDIAALAVRLAEIAPDARLDDHQQWIEQTRSVLRTIELLALLAVALIGLATVAVVIFATQARLANHRTDLELVHIMGAEDRTISAEFRRYFMIHGLKGSVLGLIFAAFVVGMIIWLLPPLGDFGQVTRISNMRSFVFVLAIPVIAILAAMITAEITVRRALLRML
jgi:cell division transport system permease protein